MNKFTELDLSPLLQHNLARNNYIQPTPVQAQSIPPAMRGCDVVATAQTGTGKTLAFLLPILTKLTAADVPKGAKGIRALILAPTRELALQIADSFGKISAGTDLRCAVVVGGLSEQTQLNSIRRGVQMIIATPGRLEDFISRKLIDLSKVGVSVLDEADRMLDMGFAPAIEKILALLPKNRQSLFFSATMDKTVERLMQRHSINPVRIAVQKTNAKTPDAVDLHVFEVEGDRKGKNFCGISLTSRGRLVSCLRPHQAWDGPLGQTIVCIRGSCCRDAWRSDSESTQPGLSGIPRWPLSCARGNRCRRARYPCR